MKLTKFEKEFIKQKCHADLETVEYSDSGFDTEKEYQNWIKKVSELKQKVEK